MANESGREIIARYLKDAIAAEKNFESQLRSFSKAGNQEPVKQLFAQHADETKRQHEMLTSRLEALGEKPSGAKSFIAHLFGMAPSSAQMGHEAEEKNTQNLIIAYAVENSEVAMYEALATVATDAGDMETEHLAREIQAQEQQTADKIWKMLPMSARDSFRTLTGGRVRGGSTV